MRKRIFCAMILAMFVLSMTPNIGLAEERSSEDIWFEANKWVEKSLQYAHRQQYEDSKRFLERFSDLFNEVRMEDDRLTMTDLYVITHIYDEAKEAVISVKMDDSKRVEAITSLRLLTDVYITPGKPLWKEVEPTLNQLLQRMNDAAESEDWNTYQYELDEFIAAYDTVRPALNVDAEKGVFQALDASIAYLNENRSLSDRSRLTEDILPHVEKHLELIFSEEGQDVSDPSLIWVIISISGVIVVCLSYVGWKKYKGEKDRYRNRRRQR
ncbi:sporulation protein YpjB [Texcoconibacillus texcoconensis]|uniref:Sporulation protein YpjB n=1 Tax=Texcoconibacillus texcoconensis TaxID=1095777 RepID=A0A840QND5_9BACI|nr:sporulation protein YpjB [Texcoconibacillus texcoconensis]MBB5172868.1 sporulation protein YpjB [Texcoconibacillus texcoconensis]